MTENSPMRIVKPRALPQRFISNYETFRRIKKEIEFKS
jgi:hypothetical protein